MAGRRLAMLLACVSVGLGLAAPSGLRGEVANEAEPRGAVAGLASASNDTAASELAAVGHAAPPGNESAAPGQVASSAEAAAATGRNVVTLYHQTSPDLARLIFKNGFRPGSYGWCGGGIYFATSPGDTDRKAIGDYSHKGFIIGAKVDVGRVKVMPGECDRSMTGAKLQYWQFDSIKFNPGDGDEYVVYSPDRILAMWHAT